METWDMKKFWPLADQIAWYFIQLHNHRNYDAPLSSIPTIH